MSDSGYSREDLAADMAQLGITPGDTLFVHSSFKSLGPVDGGAETVVLALEDAVGPEGLILMPSFNLVGGGAEGRAANWDHQTTPSTVGWLTEYFRQMPGTVRSDHYSHSVAARGADAEWIVSGHRDTQVGPPSPWDQEPWGYTYGRNSPMLRAYERPNAKLLMLGVDYNSSTYCHVVEVLDWAQRCAEDPDAQYYNYKPREKLGAFWDALGRLERGQIGDADCRLFSIKDYVDTLLAEVTRAPQLYCRWHPDNYK